MICQVPKVAAAILAQLAQGRWNSGLHQSGGSIRAVHKCRGDYPCCRRSILPAGALSEVGLPQNAIPVALLFFNLGVEAGQLLFIAAVLMVVGLACKALDIRHSTFDTRFPWAWRVPPYAIY